MYIHRIGDAVIWEGNKIDTITTEKYFTNNVLQCR